MELNEEVKSWKTVVLVLGVGGIVFLLPGIIALVWWLSAAPQLPSESEVHLQLQQQRDSIHNSLQLVLVALQEGGNVTVVRDMVGGFSDSRPQLPVIEGLRQQLGLPAILGSRMLSGAAQVRWTLIQDERGALDLFWVGALPPTEPPSLTADPLPYLDQESELIGNSGWYLMRSDPPRE